MTNVPLMPGEVVERLEQMGVKTTRQNLYRAAVEHQVGVRKSGSLRLYAESDLPVLAKIMRERRANFEQFKAKGGKSLIKDEGDV